MQLTFEQAVSLLGQIATWITVLLVFLALLESERQRKTTYKPEVVIKKIDFTGYGYNLDGIIVSYKWINGFQENISDGLDQIELRPLLKIYNLGFGSAKNIVLHWEYKADNSVRFIQEKLIEKSIPIAIHLEKQKVIVTIGGAVDSGFAEDLYPEKQYEYILPVSVESDGLSVNLPMSYQVIVSLLYLIYQHNPLEHQDKMQIPDLGLKIDYKDLANKTYSKKFVGTFLPAEMLWPLRHKVWSFKGQLEFKEI